MINYLLKSFQIDITYTVNSFLYTIKRLPVLEDLLTNDIYKSKFIKKITNLFIFLFLIIRAISLKFFYFFIIFSSSYFLFPGYLIKSYFHIYFVLTIIGLFINNKLLNTNKKKYFSIISFNMEATKYYKMTIIWNQFSNLILNSICILFFAYIIKSPLIYSIILILLSFFIRPIGECLNILFYKKYKYIWYSNTRLYTTIILVLGCTLLLPFVNIFISLNMIMISTIIIVVLGIISFIYLFKLNDYKLIYKDLVSKIDIMNSKYDKDYLKQAMVEVRNRDKVINKEKLQGKKGYDLFNTIFFERHREILIRSAKKYSLILIGIYIVISFLMIYDKEISIKVINFLNNNLGWFVIIMYFINRGAIITQAMFFNCDHAMLRYNFYKKSNNLLGLFKKRLLTVSKVNLLPAFIIGIGNIILLLIGNDINYLTMITTFTFIILLSIFFSVHYLVIYYLLQPFDKEMEVKKISYSFVTFITYIVAYLLTDLTMNSVVFSVLGLILTTVYILISLFLVYKYAPKTFKLY